MDEDIRKDLGDKVYNRMGLGLGQEVSHCGRVTDITWYKDMTGIVLQTVQGQQIAKKDHFVPVYIGFVVGSEKVEKKLANIYNRW